MSNVSPINSLPVRHICLLYFSWCQKWDYWWNREREREEREREGESWMRSSGQKVTKIYITDCRKSSEKCCLALYENKMIHGCPKMVNENPDCMRCDVSKCVLCEALTSTWLLYLLTYCRNTCWEKSCGKNILAETDAKKQWTRRW